MASDKTATKMRKGKKVDDDFSWKIMGKRCLAEMLGTAVLVAVGCGAAMGLSVGGSGHIPLAIGTALAFGLIVTALCYALGDYSGCHVNPAVSLAMLIDRRIHFKQFLAYVLSQVAGGILGAAILFGIFSHGNGNAIVASLASNAVNVELLSKSWGVSLSNGTYPNYAGLLIGLGSEILFAFVFVFTILCTFRDKNYFGASGIALGLSLTAIVLLGFNITGTGVNPARSLGTALLALANGVYEPLKEIWIFIVGPLLGSALATFAYQAIWHEQGAHVKPE